MAASIFTHVLAYLAGAYQHLGLFADSNVWAQRTVAFGVDHGVPLAQALGYEFLGENAIWTSDWDKGLAYVEREREIAARLNSRERQAWTHSVAGVCWRGRGDRNRAEREFTDGLALAELLGEQRVAVILAAEMAPLLMELGHADQALQMARQSLEWAEALGLLYMRTEARRSLADVYFRLSELDRALQLCDEVLELLAGMESKVSRLAMGPLHVEALLAANRRDEAREILSRYESLVAECQSPRFAREASRLRVILQDAGV